MTWFEFDDFLRVLCVVSSGELAVCCCCGWFVCEFFLLILVGGYEVSENGNFWDEYRVSNDWGL